MENISKDQYELDKKAKGQMQLKGNNPNQEHNIKKESMGQNTKR